MRILSKPWVAMAALAAVIAAALFGIYTYRHRFVKNEADMFALLPAGDFTAFFANVAVLRQTGMLSMISGGRSAGDPEYRRFVSETRFDYTKDLDAIAGAAAGNQIFAVIRGRFEWGRLRAYASAHGGSCTTRLCAVPSTTPGRWASFIAIQPDVMGLALSADRSAAERLTPGGRQPSKLQQPEAPVWLRVSPAVLKDPASLAPGLRIFAISLESADPVILSVEAAGDRGDAAFDVRLDAQCASEATAEVVRNQLEIQTKILKLELTREGQRPNPADLTGLLTAGTFQVVDKRVVGIWPVRKELLSALQ